MSPDAAIDHAARRFGTLAEQMGSGGIDRGRARVARQRLAAVAELLPPADRDLLRVVVTPTRDGDLPGPSVIARRLGVTRQSAHRSHSRLLRRIRRTVDRKAVAPPLPDLPPLADLVDHLVAEGVRPVHARRLGLLLLLRRPATVADVARWEGTSHRIVQQQAATAEERLRPGCPICDAVAAHRRARRSPSAG